MKDPFEDYLTRYGITMTDKLGDGKDGVVIQTSRSSAAKHLHSTELYHRELRMYRALTDAGIHRIGRFAIPRLLTAADDLCVIEMTVVSAPYFLDFASSYDDAELLYLGFTDEVWAEREQHWSEIFAEHWPEVRSARDELARLTGLMVLDLTPNNIRTA